MPTHEWAFPASPTDDPYEPTYPAGHAILTTETAGTPARPDGVIEYDEDEEVTASADLGDCTWAIFGAEILRLAREKDILKREIRELRASEGQYTDEQYFVELLAIEASPSQSSPSEPLEDTEDIPNLGSARDFAARLDGREYGEEMTDAEEAEAKTNGLLVVFGASDDLVEFRGVFTDEAGAPGRVRFDWLGLVDDRPPDGGDPDKIIAWAVRLQRAWRIEAFWCEADSGASWTYNTFGIPCADFEILEDGEVYCRGLVMPIANPGVGRV